MTLEVDDSPRNSGDGLPENDREAAAFYKKSDPISHSLFKEVSFPVTSGDSLE